MCNRHNFSGKSAQINGFFVVFKAKQTILFLPQKYSLSAWFVEFPRNLYYNKNVESGVLLFNVGKYFSQDVAIYLNQFKICIRAGNHCAKILDNVFNISNTVRISLSFYNNKEEIDLLINVLKNSSNIWKEIL